MTITKLFPIMNSSLFRAIPWEVIAECEERAMRNHSQTLTRLAERGGLSPCEAVAILENKPYWERWPGSYTKERGIEADACLLEHIIRVMSKETKV